MQGVVKSITTIQHMHTYAHTCTHMHTHTHIHTLQLYAVGTFLHPFPSLLESLLSCTPSYLCCPSHRIGGAGGAGEWGPHTTLLCCTTGTTGISGESGEGGEGDAVLQKLGNVVLGVDHKEGRIHSLGGPFREHVLGKHRGPGGWGGG